MLSWPSKLPFTSYKGCGPEKRTSLLSLGAMDLLGLTLVLL